MIKYDTYLVTCNFKKYITANFQFLDKLLHIFKFSSYYCIFNFGTHDLYTISEK